MSRSKKLVMCIRKHDELTVGKTYMVIKQNTFGRWVRSDSGRMLYVTNMYFT